MVTDNHIGGFTDILNAVNFHPDACRQKIPPGPKPNNFIKNEMLKGKRDNYQGCQTANEG
jgi:hypothetical protein